MPVKYSQSILVIIRNSLFDVVREDLKKHKNTENKQPQDLDKEH